MYIYIYIIHVYSTQKQWEPESNVVKWLNSLKRKKKKKVIPKSFVFMKKKGIVDILDKSKLMESVTCIKIYKSKYI